MKATLLDGKLILFNVYPPRKQTYECLIVPYHYRLPYLSRGIEPMSKPNLHDLLCTV